MKRLEFDEKNNLTDVLSAIRDESEKEIEVFVFPGSDVLKTPTNREIITLLAEDLGKKVVIKGGEVEKKPIGEEAHDKKENLGFVEGKDIAEEKGVDKAEALPEKKKGKFPFLKIPKWDILKKRKTLYFLGGFVGLMIVAGFLAVWFVPKATVTLNTEPRFKEAELTLIANTAQEKIDVDEGIIPLKRLDTTQEDVLEANATGTKTVGTPAKGRVKIVNRETGSKKFFAGTKIKTLLGETLTFTLDNTATISAAPAGCTNDCPETAVNVTAVAIGDKGNLASGTKFQVGSVTDTTKVVAESLTKFTGGSSKKLTIVSSGDQKKLKEKLLEKLEAKAEEELEKDNEDVEVPKGGLESEVLEETYSQKIGEEAKDFRLSLQAKFTAQVFSEEDLKELLVKSISDDIPSGFEINKEKSTVDSEILEKTEDGLKVKGKIKASLLPVINEDTVLQKIAGKDFSSTDKYLKSLNNITGFEIKLNPSFFRIFGTMPFSKSRIKLKVIQKE